MEKICELNLCTGCLACMNACPKEAISIGCDNKGLMIPVIDSKRCIDCGLCVKTCPTINPVNRSSPIIAYAGWNLDEKKHALSSSGGIARAMYDYVLRQGGVCYGAKFDNNLDLIIARATTASDVDDFRGSKYVQAIVGDSLKSAKSDLDKGLLVLYVGTPCQIAGLKSYLKREYENLITVDLICHGVPSIKFLHEHVKFIENKIGKSADDIKFRGEYDFKFSLYCHGELIYKKDRWWDTYYTAFSKCLLFRPSCYECAYACESRISDITIGDFWGIGKEKPFKAPEIPGISVILPNTKKGLSYVESIKERIYIEERPLSEAINGNPHLRKASDRHQNLDVFETAYVCDGFEKAVKLAIKDDMKRLQRREIRGNVRKIKLFFRKVVKRFWGH